MGRDGSSLPRSLARAAGGTSALLLMLLLTVAVSTALGVADRIRGVDALLALTLTTVALFAGWLISLTPLSGAWASPVVGMLGLVVVLFRVGRLGGEWLGLSRAWNGFLWDALRWAWGGPAPSGGLVSEALSRLAQEGGTLLARVSAWAAALAGGGPTFDPAAVAFVWGLGLWASSAWAGWLIRRRRAPLTAIAPSAALLLTAFFHVWGSHVYLLGLLLAGFLLMALISYDGRLERWRATNVDYPELRPQTIAVTVLLSLALVTMAEVLPSISLDGIVELASRASGGRSQEAEAVAESFGMDQREQTVFREARTGGLPRSHLLGAGPELSQRLVMIVGLEGQSAAAAGAPLAGEPPRHYWQSHTYDRYTGSGWAAATTAAVAYEAGVPAITRTLPAQRVVRQEVRWLGEGGALAHAAGTLMVADRDYEVAWRSPQDPFAVTIRGRVYRADSFIPLPDAQGLRLDQGGYPAWVRERYLPLPDEVPERVLSLARDLTATAATRYDRARAIEAYLRMFPYTLDVSTPPPSRDVVDYFLFDLKRGYCDYYASAMVVLARAAGLPARLAVGYVSGSYDPDEGRYVVTEADAHAWPELYFPTYGWVRFEPTGGRQALKHVAEAGFEPVEPEGALEPAAGRWAGLRRTWWQVLLGGLAVLGLGAVAWQGLDRWRLNRWEPEMAVASLYRRLRRFGRRLDVPVRAGDTPREFGVRLAGQVGAVLGDWTGDQPRRAGKPAASGPWRAMRRHVVDLRAAGRDEVIWLTDLYGRSSYSPRAPDAADRERALQVWDRLRWRLRFAYLMRVVGLVTSPWSLTRG